MEQDPTRQRISVRSPVGQVLAPAFTLRGLRTWGVVGQVIDLPLYDDGEGRSQRSAQPGLRFPKGGRTLPELETVTGLREPCYPLNR